MVRMILRNMTVYRFRGIMPPMSAYKLFNNDSYQLYKRLLKSTRPYLGFFLVGMIATALASGVDATLAWLVKPLINEGFIAKDLAFIQWLPIGIIIIFVVRGATGFASNYYITRVGRDIVRDFRIQVFKHLLKLPANFYDKQSSGSLLSLIMYNAEQIALASTFAFLTLVQEASLAIGLIIVMFAISWKLTLLFLLSAPLSAILMKYVSNRIRLISNNIQKTVGTVTHVAEETIDGYKVVRTFGGENYELHKFESVTEANRQQELKVVVTDSIGSSAIQLLAAIPISIILYISTSPNTAVSAGSFAAMMAAMLSLLRPLRRLTRINVMIQKGLAGAQSVYELLDEETEKDTGTLSVERVNGHLTFQHVEFNYPNNEHSVLKNINFTVAPGQTIAIVGRSGGGKSTLVSLLPRFYDLTGGQILIDNVNILDYQLASLRQQFALVTQEVILFNDTIAKNIAYGAENNIDKNRLIEVAGAAYALEFIQNLEQGFDTIVGENGLMLSGGQRQRIAIARALYRNSPILILDEATSALDTESERYIQAALDELMKNRTTIVIAHRLSTIEKADRILVLEKGHIVEMGTHQELLEKGAYYSKLHAQGFDDNSIIEESTEEVA